MTEREDWFRKPCSCAHREETDKDDIPYALREEGMEESEHGSDGKKAEQPR